MLKRKGVCTGVSEAERSRERKHYLVIRYLSGSHYDAIDYLYNRLNIIDAKTSTLMTVNGLLLATMTFLLGAAVSTDHEYLHFVSPKDDPGMWFDKTLIAATIVVVLFLTLSTICCFFIFSLTFDHIVSDKGVPTNPDRPSVAELETVLNGNAPYGAGSSSTIVAAGTLTDYEESFFCVTIKRQRYLRWASWFAKIAGLVVMLSLLAFAALLWR